MSAFLRDAKLTLVGYQVHFEKLEEGLFLFNHEVCHTTLAVAAGAFQPLHQGPIFTQRATGGADCLGYCLHRDNLLPCPAECECAYVRQVIQVIRHWPKIG